MITRRFLRKNFHACVVSKSRSRSQNVITPNTIECSPIKKYSDLLDMGVMKPDQSQFSAMLKLQELHNKLQNYHPHQEKLKDEGNVEVAASDGGRPNGLYMYGGVGTGKTLLLDIFYDSVTTSQKKRVHFNAFMLFLYSELNRWNLCCDEEDDIAGHFSSPVEYIANKILKDTWLICFDEIQVSDFASFTLLEGVLGYMISRGAVVVGTSNRSPDQLSNSSITGENDEVEVKKPSSFRDLFTDSCEIHHVQSERDHRVEMKPGESRYIYPLMPENKLLFDLMFTKLVEPGSRISSKFLKIYNRKILIPVSVGSTARFNFKELCMVPFGPADYLKICNEYSHIFIDEVPKLSIHRKNEARRFLTFIDAAYETRAKIYCTAESAPENIFLMLPRSDEKYEPEQMHLEMIGEIAYDLKLAGLDFKSLNLISGEDEIFSFKRAISRLKEMQSEFYQKTDYRKQHFVPYTGSETEKQNAEAARRTREKRRLEQQAIEQEAMGDNNDNIEENTERSWNLREDFPETDWGDEASYTSLSKETVVMMEKNRRGFNNRQLQAPKFGEKHFWGFGWWEHVKNKLKSKNENQ